MEYTSLSLNKKQGKLQNIAGIINIKGLVIILVFFLPSLCSIYLFMEIRSCDDKLIAIKEKYSSLLYRSKTDIEKLEFVVDYQQKNYDQTTKMFKVLYDSFSQVTKDKFGKNLEEILEIAKDTKMIWQQLYQHHEVSQYEYENYDIFNEDTESSYNSVENMNDPYYHRGMDSEDLPLSPQPGEPTP